MRIEIFQDDYLDLLTEREQTCLRDAEEEYDRIYALPASADRDLLVYLGDSFCNRKTWSGTSRTLGFVLLGTNRHVLKYNKALKRKMWDVYIQVLCL